MGDLGEKPQKELENFRMITKSPYGHAMVPPLGAMVPLQYGKEADRIMEGTDDPKKNAEAVKAALYYLGADMVGICELPDYAWYSHDLDGSEIKPYHKYGIAILVDQGYETMEGASGDDWISGAQSMRAYLRAAIDWGCCRQPYSFPGLLCPWPQRDGPGRVAYTDYTGGRSGRVEPDW